VNPYYASDAGRNLTYVSGEAWTNNNLAVLYLIPTLPRVFFFAPRIISTPQYTMESANMATSQVPQGSQPVAVVCVGMAGQ
jgi:hypothetical protein